MICWLLSKVINNHHRSTLTTAYRRRTLVAITEQDRTQIMGAAKALFAERKTFSLDDLTDYLRSVVNVKVDPADVEESLSRLFERQGGNLPALELHQCMLFRRSALAYWLGQYAILVMEEVYKSEPAEGEK